MATRSLIGMVREDKSVQVIYCHWDGYPEYVGLQLQMNYNDKEIIEKLLELGDRSSLKGAPDYESTYKNMQNQEVQKWIYSSKQEFYESDKSGAEYIYLWDNIWTVYKAYSDNDMENLGTIEQVEVKFGKLEA